MTRNYRARPANQRILITGASGLVGTALTAALSGRGDDVVPLDLRAPGQARGDVCDLDGLRQVMADVDGVVHLAAVSRIQWAERDPEACRRTNVEGVRNVLAAAAEAPDAPWVVFASSREVYGQAETLPVTETAALRPVNVYGRSKVAGEALIDQARREGLRACILRLSNVYGAVADHADRVVPAFVRAALLGQALRIEGGARTLDFTHLDDVTRGFLALTQRLASGEPAPPPLHLVTGIPTTLADLAAQVCRITGSHASMEPTQERTFDIQRFVGSHARATQELGWRPGVSLEEGLTRLAAAFRDPLACEAARTRASVA